MLVGLDLLWRINSIPKALAVDAKDAAWAFCDALTKHSLGENEDSGDFPLPWVEQPLELSPPLTHMLKHLSLALDPYDRSKLTKDLSFVKDIPREASVNNYRKEVDAQIEKVHRALETSALHIARSSMWPKYMGKGWPKCMGKGWPKYIGKGWPKCMGMGCPKYMGKGWPNAWANSWPTKSRAFVVTNQSFQNFKKQNTTSFPHTLSRAWPGRICRILKSSILF